MTVSIKEKLDLENIPRHVAIIMDGNGRWAKKKGMARVFGHKSGSEAVREAVDSCASLGVECLTLYTFSTENWNRPQSEVTFLMNLIAKKIKEETPELHRDNVRITQIGDFSALPKTCKKNFTESIELTKNNTGLNLCIALNYSGRWDLTEAVRKIAAKAGNGEIDPNSINAETITAHLSTASMPEPELLIRTGGDQRISNFLLWELAYSEFFFSSVFWPDFKKEHVYEAVYEYQNRERRFGMTSEQVSA